MPIIIGTDDKDCIVSSITNVKTQSTILGPNQSMVVAGTFQIQSTATFQIGSNSRLLLL